MKSRPLLNFLACALQAPERVVDDTPEVRASLADEPELK
jgi:hypothetical protein